MDRYVDSEASMPCNNTTGGNLASEVGSEGGVRNAYNAIGARRQPIVAAAFENARESIVILFDSKLMEVIATLNEGNPTFNYGKLTLRLDKRMILSFYS